MRTGTLFALALFLPTVVACGAASDSAEDSGQAVVGGADDVESSTVFFFASQDAKAKPSCIGAMISSRMAVTLRACAKEGLVVGRAEDDQGKGRKRGTVKTVHLPEAGEIAVAELDRDLEGGYALITNAPLREGYAVNGVASVDGGILYFGAEEGDGSIVEGRMVSETDTTSTLVPKGDALICATDLGAPVCSTTTGRSIPIFGTKRQTCGLSGLILAPGTEAPAAKDNKPAGCFGGPATVVTLGQHAAFLKRLAPQAFQPYVTKKWVPEGLWGHKSAGTIASCKLETETLPSVDAKKDVRIKASARFAMMEENARAYGRIGLAPKSDPTKIVWLPMKASKDKGEAFDASFEGVVAPELPGEYIVAFRASANGGETWTVCDREGKAASLDPNKALTLVVNGATDPSAPPTTTLPSAPTTTPPVATNASSEFSDPPAAPTETSDTPESANDGAAAPPAPMKRKKKADDGGCSASPRSGSGSAGSFGLLLALAAFVRRRRS